MVCTSCKTSYNVLISGRGVHIYIGGGGGGGVGGANLAVLSFWLFRTVRLLI